MLKKRTDFVDISFPVSTSSPRDGDRHSDGGDCDLTWNYPDALAVPSIGMEMPKLLNAGPVAARIAFFAPVSLAFFVTVLLPIGGLKGLLLHPMHVFFVPAGFFAFHLQFAYLVFFSSSFFFDGLTGITLTVCSVATLALLMAITAKVDWSSHFTKRGKLVPNIAP